MSIHFDTLSNSSCSPLIIEWCPKNIRITCLVVWFITLCIPQVWCAPSDNSYENMVVSFDNTKYEQMELYKVHPYVVRVAGAPLRVRAYMKLNTTSGRKYTVSAIKCGEKAKDKLNMSAVHFKYFCLLDSEVRQRSRIEAGRAAQAPGSLQPNVYRSAQLFPTRSDSAQPMINKALSLRGNQPVFWSEFGAKQARR